MTQAPLPRARAQLLAPPVLRAPLGELLRTGGVEPVEDDDAPVVAVCLGSPTPATADGWMRESRPHLLVGVAVDAVRLGPFVVPGVTACLRCLDAEDPPPAAEPGMPAPSLVVLAAGWVAEDVRRWHAGVRPATWSTTVHLGTDLRPARRTWWRHPHCGCSWGLTAQSA